MTKPAPHDAALSPRRRSLMRRMMAGEAAASLFCYRRQVTVDPLVHGLLDDGRLVVVAPRGEELRQVIESPDGAGNRARLDLVKMAPDPRVVVRVASMHLLVDIQWLPADLWPLAALPARCADAVHDLGEHAVVAVLDFEKAFLHDGDGIVAAGRAELATAVASPMDAGMALDWASGRCDQALTDLADAGLRGELRAEFTPVDLRLAAGATLPSECHCLDLSEGEVSVLRAVDDGYVIVHVPFAQCPAGPADLPL